MRELTSTEIQAASGCGVLEGGDGWLGFSWDESAGIIMAVGGLGGPVTGLFGAIVGLSMLWASPEDTDGGSASDG
jgi:hypothetical protein